MRIHEGTKASEAASAKKNGPGRVSVLASGERQDERRSRTANVMSIVITQSQLRLARPAVAMALASVFVAVFVFGTLLISDRRLLWPDEMSTYLLARLPELSDVWTALAVGGDGLPPFYYVIVRMSAALLSADALGLRLPSLLGFLLASVCLFRFVAARMPVAFATLAAMFPALTGAYYYAHEARSYALVLGFAALALRLWQRATSEGKSAVGFALALAAAIACHYYAVLLVLPFALAEFVRTAPARRLDWRIWSAMAAAPLPVLAALPIVSAAAGSMGSPWMQADLAALREFYLWLLLPAGAPLAAAAILVVAIGPSWRQGEEKGARRDWGLPRHEIVAATAFAALPVAGLVLGKLTGWFAGRYVLATVIGLALLFPLAVYRLSSRNVVLAVVIAAIALVWFVRTELHQLSLARNGQNRLQAEIAFLAAQPEAALPIVAADPHTFGELDHYAPPEIGARLAYLASPEEAQRILGYTSIDIAMMRYIGPWTPANVVDFGAFTASTPRFLVYGDPGKYSWILPVLGERGRRIVFLARLQTEPGKHKQLFLVEGRD